MKQRCMQGKRQVNKGDGRAIGIPSEQEGDQPMPAVNQTAHLLLRPWQENDVNPLVRLRAWPAVTRALRLDGQPFTPQETARVHRRSMLPHFTPPPDGDPNGVRGGVEALGDGVLTAPADFSAEEVALACGLQRLFPLDQEQVIRCFGLPCAHEEGAWNALNGLERRVSNRVFQRLQLPRRLVVLHRAGPAHGPHRRRWLGVGDLVTLFDQAMRKK